MKTKVFNKLNIRIISVLIALFIAAGITITLTDLHSIRKMYEKSYTDRLMVSNMLLSGLIDPGIVSSYVDLLTSKDDAFKKRQLDYAKNRTVLSELETRGADDSEKAPVIDSMRAFREEMNGLKGDDYYETVNKLINLRDHSKTKYVYVFADTGVRDEDGTVYYTYIFDAEDTEDKRLDFDLDSDGLGTVDTYDETADTVYATGKQMEEAVFYNVEPYGKLYYVFSPILDSDGNVIAVMGTDMDVTEMYGQIRAAVLINAAIFLALAVAVGTVIYFFISRQIIRPISAVALTAQRLAEGDIYAKVPENVLRSKTELGVLASVVDGMGSVYRDMLTSTSDVLNAASIGRLDVRNDPSRFKGGIAEAVTLTNAALDATALYLNGIPDSIFIISKDLEIYFRNTHSKAVFGDTDGESLLKSALEGTSELDAKALSLAFSELLKSGSYSVISWINKSCFSFEFREIAPEGGTADSVLVIAVDITALINEKINAQAANAAKSEFLSRVSHELRTPMNVIIGMAALGIKESLDKSVSERFRNIDSASRQLLSIINDVLDMSRIESGKMEIHPEEFDLRALFADCAAFFDSPVKEKGLTFTAKVSPEVPNLLYGDGQRLKQILINLISNSVKFTESGSISMEATAAPMSCGKVSLQIAVRDTGIGMSESFIKKIFTPFEQEEMYLQRRSKGTGLGLPICKNLAELMGGEITVASTHGKGSVFTVLLPFETRDVSAKKKSAAAKNEGARLFGMRVLLVDDIEINRLIFKEMLAEKGLEITEASDGTDAITAFTESPEFFYDIIFMDIQMEKMDGYEATRRIRASNRKDSGVPIIAMTANALKQDVDNSLSCGMNGHIAKPVDFDACVSVMRKYYKRKKL